MRGRIWLVLGLIALVALAACVATPRVPGIGWPDATPAPAGLRGLGTPIPRQILIPLYQYPKRYLTPAATDTWTLAASANFSNTVMAVIDPICNSWTTGSGGPTCGMRPWESPRPGSGVPDSNMVTGMTELKAAGILQLGYVSTYFGAQITDSVKGQIDIYATSPYTAFIDGIFFDEVRHYADDWLPYYTELCAYAYAAGLDYVVLNLDGWADNAEKFVSTPIANLHVMFEGYPADWHSYLSPFGTPPAWIPSYPRTSFAMVLLDTDAGDLTARLTEAYNRNYGVVFITDAASYTAAYENSPAYLPTEVALWSTLLGTAGPTATTGPTATAGPYLSPTPTPPVTATTAPSRTPTRTVTPGATSTPAYWWDNMEGTPPGKWERDDAAATPAYGATVVAITGTVISPAQAYKVDGVWTAGLGTARGGLGHTLATTATHGIFSGSVMVNNFNDWPTQEGFVLINAAGKHWQGFWNEIWAAPQIWSIYATSDAYNGGAAAGVYLRGETAYPGDIDVNVKIGITPTLNTWYDFEVIWDLAAIPSATSYLTATWAGVMTAVSATHGIHYVLGVQNVTAGVYGSYLWGTKPSVNLDDFWAVEGALTTPTPAPTPTPNPAALWPELACPQLAVTVDGATTEWAAVTPYTLTLATAEYTWPLTPTVPAGLTGLYRCAHNGALLYLSGVITDTTVVSPTGSLENGDAARIVLDGLADGDFRHLLDDHDVLIGSNGAARDFEFYPIGATTAISRTAGGWQWEMSLPLVTLQASTAVGEIVGLTFGYHDSIGGATWAHVLTGAKRAGRLE